MKYEADTEIPHSGLDAALKARSGWELLHVLELKVPGSQALPMVTLIWGKEERSEMVQVMDRCFTDHEFTLRDGEPVYRLEDWVKEHPRCESCGSRAGMIMPNGLCMACINERDASRAP